jgi:hypothetical protein
MPTNWCVECGRGSEKIDAVSFRQRYVDWVILHNLSFEAVVAPDTRNLIATGAHHELSQMLPTSGNTLSKYIVESLQSRKPFLDDSLSSARSRIHLSCDGWKSPAKFNYIAICAHYFNYDYAQTSTLIGLRRLVGSKTGENEAKLIFNVLCDFTINLNNIGAVVMDNAVDNDAMMRHLEQHLGQYSGWGDENRLRCLGHIINLVVKAILFGTHEAKVNKQLEATGVDEGFEIWAKLGPIGKCYNICVYVNRNDERRTEFRHCQTLLTGDLELVFSELNLIQDGGIRWHRTSDMIERFLLLERAVRSYQLQYVFVAKTGVDLRPSFVNDEDFDALRRWSAILKSFKLMCKDEEGRPGKDMYGTLAGVFYGLTRMEKEIIAAQKASIGFHSEAFIAGLEAGYQKVMKYWEETKHQSIYYAAIALNPATRMLWFDDHWSGYGKEWRLLAHSKFKQIYDLYAVREETRQQWHGSDASPSPSLQESQELAENTVENSDPYKASTGLSAAFVARKRRRINTIVTESEYVRYVDRFDFTNDEIPDVPSWWREHSVEFPILSSMALDILAVPAMSTEVERVFSDAGRLISDDRGSLGDPAIEACVIQHHGLKTGLFTSGVCPGE